MAEEEKDNNTTMSSDDLDALRILLHNVKGLCSVSWADEIYTEYED